MQINKKFIDDLITNYCNYEFVNVSTSIIKSDIIINQGFNLYKGIQNWNFIEKILLLGNSVYKSYLIISEILIEEIPEDLYYYTIKKLIDTKCTMLR